MKCKRISRGLLAVAVAGALTFAPVAGAADQPFVTDVYAHCGGGHHGGYGCGNGYGGHHAGSGVCYYYCGGHAAHLHNNGVCPYAAKPAPKQQSKVNKSTVKKVQRKLNRLGYNCGKVNGVMNAKTKKAVKKFKISRGLRADSVIRKPMLRALGL